MIREAIPGDIPVLVSLASAMHQESRFRVFPFSDRKIEATFRACIELPHGIAFAAERAGRVIGFAAGAICDHPLFDMQMAFEYGIYVLPEHRGSLAGLRLLRAYVQRARDAGVMDINAGVTTAISLDRTARLYELAGLYPIGSLFNTTR
ncbi:GNAT family N-acetyltransferase [Burkholderia plantarii]|uniref:GNAT family N-acetyltransferase n=1 Tax=Burkholderia plantarii TaxID=41899 RepID=UPI000870A884|nr:GNAT family N-acetyltransferase [Burkholderia plantarii]